MPEETSAQKQTKPNIEKWPESLWVMLEFWYIERGNIDYVKLRGGERGGDKQGAFTGICSYVIFTLLFTGICPYLGKIIFRASHWTAAPAKKPEHGS